MQDDPLARMRDIHLPEAPAFWPPAPGWWIVAVLVLLLLGWAVHLFVRQRRRRAPARQALAELERDFDACMRGDLATAEAINRANALLKRLWVHVEGNQSIAALSGDAWLHYLDRRSGTEAFTAGPGSVLGAARFASSPPAFDAELYQLLRTLLQSRAPESP